MVPQTKNTITVAAHITTQQQMDMLMASVFGLGVTSGMEIATDRGTNWLATKYPESAILKRYGKEAISVGLEFITSKVDPSNWLRAKLGVLQGGKRSIPVKRGQARSGENIPLIFDALQGHQQADHSMETIQRNQESNAAFLSKIQTVVTDGLEGAGALLDWLNVPEDDAKGIAQVLTGLVVWEIPYAGKDMDQLGALYEALKQLTQKGVQKIVFVAAPHDGFAPATYETIVADINNDLERKREVQLTGKELEKAGRRERRMARARKVRDEDGDRAITLLKRIPFLGGRIQTIEDAATQEL